MNKALPREVESLTTINNMKRTLFALAALALFLPAAQVSKAADVSVDFFYNNLSGGDWIEVADYGYVWQPSVAVSNTSWRPYSDGYWAYTDVGWTWVSYEDFGWATYHYGRWSRLHDYGWVWVPGRDEDLEWGPAWVSWRTGGSHIGWAPLPPSRERIYAGRAITGHVDVEFDIGPSYYNFVDVRYIGEPVLRERIIDVNQNVTYINQTTNVTNITYNNNTVYNYGPDINVLNASASRPIQRLKLERQENFDVSAGARSGALIKPQGDKLVVAAPMHIRKAERQIAPPKIKTKVAKGNFDTGWSGVSDPNVKTQMQQKMKTEDVKQAQVGAQGPQGAVGATGPSPAASASAAANVAGQVGPSPAASASASTSVSAATAATSPAPVERGKGKHQNKLNQQNQLNATGPASASPASSALSATGAPPSVAASPADATAIPARGGKHNGKHADQVGAQATGAADANAAATAAPNGGANAGAAFNRPPATTEPAAPNEGEPRGGKHNRKALEQTASPQAQSQSGDLPSEQGLGQGKHKNRSAEPPTGGAELQQEGVSRGKQPPEQEMMKRQGRAPMGNAEGPSGQPPVKPEGKKNKAEETPSPVPSP